MRKIPTRAVLLLIIAITVAFTFSSCDPSPIAVVSHDPIYPSGSQQVTYWVNKATTGAISSAKLYEQISTINSSGVVTSAGSDVLLNSWTSPTGDLSHSSSSKGINKLITYRWEITTPDYNRSYTVTYCTRPYPVSDMPAPVYCQGDPDDVFDVVFIPDNDITNMSNFRTHCRGAILESFFDEPTTRFWRRQFNFYINPERGTATDYDRIATDGLHQTPSNYAFLSFAEGKVLMHQNNLRDYASGGLFSTEMQNRGTILHEAGHALFDLADEYNGGVHWQESILPNNWSSLAGAQGAASGYGSCKTTTDAVQMGTAGWYKLCVETCQMKTTGLNHTTYDCPCKYRINYVTLDNALN